MVVQQTGAVKDVLTKISLLTVPTVATQSEKAVKSKYGLKTYSAGSAIYRVLVTET